MDPGSRKILIFGRRKVPSNVSSGAPGAQLVYADNNGKAMGMANNIKGVKSAPWSNQQVGKHDDCIMALAITHAARGQQTMRVTPPKVQLSPEQQRIHNHIERLAKEKSRGYKRRGRGCIGKS